MGQIHEVVMQFSKRDIPTDQRVSSTQEQIVTCFLGFFLILLIVFDWVHLRRLVSTLPPGALAAAPQRTPPGLLLFRVIPLIRFCRHQ